MDTKNLSILTISTINGIFYFFYLIPIEFLTYNPTKIIIHTVTMSVWFGLLYCISHTYLGILYQKNVHEEYDRNILKDMAPSMSIMVIGYFFQYFLHSFVITGGEHDFIDTHPAIKFLGFLLLILTIPILIVIIPPHLLFILGYLLSENKKIPDFNFSKVKDGFNLISKKIDEFGVKRL